MTTPDDETYRISLGALPDAPFRARRFITALLAKWGVTDPETADNALLLISEITANAVIATGRETGPDEADPAETVPAIEVRVRSSMTHLTVEVWDNSPTLPTPVTADLTSESGRGLFLVNALAANWGSTPEILPPRDTPGKTVWFTLALPQAIPLPALPPQRARQQTYPPLPRRARTTADQRNNPLLPSGVPSCADT